MNPAPDVTYFVHYTAKREDGTLVKLVAGPYNEDEAITARRELSHGNGVVESFLDTDNRQKD